MLQLHSPRTDSGTACKSFVFLDLRNLLVDPADSLRDSFTLFFSSFLLIFLELPKAFGKLLIPGSKFIELIFLSLIFVVNRPIFCQPSGLGNIFPWPLGSCRISNWPPSSSLCTAHTSSLLGNACWFCAPYFRSSFHCCHGDRWAY